MRLVSSKTCLVGLLFALCSACLTTPTLPVAYRGSASYEELSERVHRQKNYTLDSFRKNGPFKFEKITNFQLPLSRKEKVLTDLFIPASRSKTPLVIISHGNDGFKEVHRFQAERLASWGMHVLVLNLPNRNQWVLNGKTINDVATMIHGWPALVSKGIDPDNIILMGHSFGGSAITIAAGGGAPVKGLVMLDPAVVHRAVVEYMKKVDVPVILLGADEKVFQSRRRWLFYKNIPSEMLEISLRGATHNDAQYPTVFAMKAFGYDPEIDPQMQETFLAAIVSSTLSLANSGSTYFAWKVFKGREDDETFKMVRQKTSEEDNSKYADSSLAP